MRVAITGFGVVSPVGVGREAFWNSLRNGISGIGPITRFDASTFSVRLAGEVSGIPPLPVEVRQTAAADPKVGFAFAACAEALAQAGIARFDESTLLHLGASLETFDLNRVIHGGCVDFKTTATLGLTGRAAPIQIPLDTAARLIAGSYGRPGRSLTNCSACPGLRLSATDFRRCARAGLPWRCAAGLIR